MVTGGHGRLVVEAIGGCEPEIGRLLWAVEDARRRTLENLVDVTDEDLDRPASASANTIGALLYHIAVIETSWLYDEALRQPIPADVAKLFPLDDRDEQHALSALAGQGLASYLQRLEVVRSKLLREYKKMSLAEFRQIHSFEAYDATPEWILYHLMQHEGEHRGQIQVMIESLHKPTES